MSIKNTTAWLLGIAALAANPAQAAYTDLDTSFGNNGIVALSVSSSGSQAMDVAVGLSGDLYVLLDAPGPQTYVARLLPNGVLDTGFGSGGYLRLAKGGIGQSLAVDDTLNQLYVAGCNFFATGNCSTPEILRFGFDGLLDQNYASGGAFGLSGGQVPAGAAIGGLLLLPDGKLSVAGGGRNSNNSNSGEVVLFEARLTSAGAFDASFGNGGVAQATVAGTTGETSYQFKPAYDQNRGLVYTSGGYFNTSGGGTANAVLARFTGSGGVDTSFGSGGLATFGYGGGTYPTFFVTGLASNGNVYAAGGTDQQSGLVGFTAAGALNTAFGSGGVQGGGGSIASVVTPSGIAAQTNGAILVAGLPQPGGGCSGQTCVVRYVGDPVLANTTASNTAAVPTPSGGTVQFTSSAGQMTRAEPVANPAGAPSGYYIYPDGFYAYSVSGLTPGSTITLTVQAPAGTHPSAWVKCQNGNCAAYPNTSISGDTITLTLTDGGAGDADGVANGVITDPGAPAVAPSGSGSSSSSSGGGSSSSSSGSSGSSSSSGGLGTPAPSGSGGGAAGPGMILWLVGAALLRRRAAVSGDGK